MSFATVWYGIYLLHMKKQSNKTRLVFTVLFLMIGIFANAQSRDTKLVRCVTAERDSLRILQRPSLLKAKEKSEEIIQDYLRSGTSRMRISADDIITIPVVIHVVHNQKDNAIGGAGNSNISDEQIQSQIDVLNEDYGNKSGYKGFYTDSLAVDTGIRFKLVGIVRKYSSRSNFSPVTESKVLAEISPAWMTSRYLNIWVCRLANNYLGVSQFPIVTETNNRTSGLLLKEDEDDALTDGVIIDSQYFGRNSTGVSGTVYNLGRTTTHEVGHWFGLLHTWGDKYCGTDYCADTPRAENQNETTDISCKAKFSFCDGVRSRNMIENYMDYSPDRCMSVFTNNQKERMRAVLALSPRRAKVVEYSKKTDLAVTVEVYPNPADEVLYTNIYTPDYKTFSVTVFNSLGKQMTDETPNQAYVNVKGFPAGIYILRVNVDDEIISKRFLIR